MYSSGFVLPLARAAGIYDELIDDHGFMSVHPAPTACYETIVSGVATEMIPRLFLTGSWANDVPPESSDAPKTADGEFDVLRAVRARGFATAEQIAASTGLPLDVVSSRLADATAQGFVKQRSGRVTGARLTASGRARLLLLAEGSLTEAELRQLEIAYRAFLQPNREFKLLTTRWQTDKDFDATTGDLAGVHSSILTVLSDAADVDARFTIYSSRLDNARDRFQSGEHTALAAPLSESYHDVWMELHEDLLATLRRARTDDDE